MSRTGRPAWPGWNRLFGLKTWASRAVVQYQQRVTVAQGGRVLVMRRQFTD
jgi:hypothetical protein